MFILLSFGTYSKYRMDKYNSLLEAVNNYNYNFEIPKNLYENPANLKFLKKAAKENNVNFLRVISYYNQDTQETYTNNFIYLSTETKLFKTVHLTKGRVLSPESMETDGFLSTKLTDSDTQIGYIEDFGGGHNYYIYTIDKLIEEQTLSGRYKAECASQKDFEQFLNTYTNYIRQNPDIDRTFFIENVEDNTTIKNESTNNILPVFAYCMTLLLITFIFYFVSQTKTISVMKMNGYTVNQIKTKIFSLLYIKCMLYTHVLMIVILLITVHDITIEFVLKLTLNNGIAFVLSYLILAIICYIYIKHTDIIYCIKGKRPIGAIVIFNLCLKIIVCVIIVIIGTNLFQKADNVLLKQKSLEGWKMASNYGVFYPIMTGNDTDSIRAGQYTLDIPTYQLYLEYLSPILKAIYVNSSEYTVDSISETSGKSEYIRNMYVNTNYLDLFPIYDENGKKIEISNSEEKSVFLVPQKYKDNESQILEYFLDFRKSFYELHIEHYKQSEKPNATDIKIIYTKNNQDVFSFNIDVFPDSGNKITDPVIMVMTEANVLVPDVNYQSSSNINLFIPLKNNNVNLTYSDIREKLRQYNLDDNFPYLVKIQDFILESISQIESELSFLKVMLCIIFLLLVIILVQYVYLLFQKDKFELFLKKSLGYNYFQKYNSTYVVLAITNIIEFLICFLLTNYRFIWILVFKIVVELLISSILIIYFEKRNVIQILKEGI